MRRTAPIWTGGISAIIGVPVTIALYPPSAIPVAVLAVIATIVVAWHLKRGGRALIRRTRTGHLSITLDSVGRPLTPRRPR